MKIHRITSKSDPEQVIDFLKKCHTGTGDGRGTINPDSLAKHNMKLGWHPDGLLDLIFRQHRFDCDSGGYYISEPTQGEIWGYGCYRSEIYPDVVVTGVRLMSKARFTTNRIIGLHHQSLRLAWQSEGLHGEYCTFNDYNVKIMNKIFRINDPRNFKSARQIGSDWYRSDQHMLLNYSQAGPYKIRNTPQFILYNMYKPEFTSDFLTAMAQNTV